MKNIGNVLWGFVLIVIGVIIGINTLGIARINIFFDGWWTLFIIVPCFIDLFKDKNKMGDIIAIIIGIILLMCCQDIMSFDNLYKLAIPVILILIGLSFIFKDLFNKKISKEIKKINARSKDKSSVCATFSGQNIKYPNELFNGVELNAIFGGIKYDLTNAKIEEDVVINTTSIFGGVDIFVKDNVNVKIKSSCLFGGVNNKKLSQDKEGGPIIYINAVCIFGGVDIK